MDSKGGFCDASDLAATWHEHLTVDLENDKWFALSVQGIFVLLAAIAAGAAFLPGANLWTGWSPVVTTVVTIALCLIYMAVHEATHGVALRLLTRVRSSYTVRFPFLSTGNLAYLTRRNAVIVALSPGLLWGMLLLVALLSVPNDFRLTLYVVLALNFAGSAGDIVEVYVVLRQRRGALIQDDGSKIRVFVPYGGRPHSTIGTPWGILGVAADTPRGTSAGVSEDATPQRSAGKDQ